MAELRSAIFIDQLQPQTMCYLGTWVRGRLPRTGMAAGVIEVAPGLDIEPLTDIVVKQTEAQAGILVVERQFGYVEFHSRSTSAVQSATSAVLDELGAVASDAIAPTILAAKLVSRLDHQHAFLINRNKLGSMALAGESLFVLEMAPASYAILAVNEAEKAAAIKVVDYRMIGATGRVYLTGTESDVRTAAEAASAALGEAAMSSDADMRRLAREVLAELVPELAAAVPQAPSPPVALVPAPPVAAVLRPSTWAAAAVPGELVGDGPPASAASAASAAPESDAPAPATPGSDRPAPAPPPGEHRTEVVTMHDNEDLDRFVRALIRRLENPRDRLAIRTGRLRFVLDRASASSAVAAAPVPELRVERGAVTERVVRRAADERARLVLAPAAVLTPLARELAASLHVKIEKEPRC